MDSRLIYSVEAANNLLTVCKLSASLVISAIKKCIFNKLFVEHYSSTAFK